MSKFRTKLVTVNGWTIVLLPIDASTQLPSRGMVLVKGTFNGAPLTAVLEPDGRGSHWFRVDQQMLDAIHTKPGDTVEVVIESSNDWPEPRLPEDVASALFADPETQELWNSLTPMARWDWLRWVRATASQDTRAHRIEVAISKLKHGERRPCCFNRAMCTEPSVSKSGVLLAPAQ